MEDNIGDVGLIREALEEHAVRCTLTVIANGEAAIRIIDETDAGIHACPHLIIVDLNLPKRSGKEVLKWIRSSRRCKHVPVVVLTSSDNQKDRDDVAALGPSRYLPKPSRLDDFLALGGLFKAIIFEGL